MKYLVLTVSILLVFSAAGVQAGCWKDVGEKEQMGFGSDEQVKAMQAFTKADRKCKALGVSWRIELETGLVLDSALIYEREPQRLWRIKVENMTGVYKDSIPWLGWTTVTDEKIGALRPETGFELDGQRSGKGVPQLQA